MNLHLAASSATSLEDFTFSGSSNGSGQMVLVFFPPGWRKMEILVIPSISLRPELRTSMACNIDCGCSLSTLQASVSWCLHSLRVLQEHQAE